MRLNIPAYILLFFLCALPLLVHAQPTRDSSFRQLQDNSDFYKWDLPRVSKKSTGQSLPYKIISVRANTDTNPNYVKKPIPVILYLHGAGERGNDNEKHVNINVPKLLKTLSTLFEEEFDIIAPQCPENHKWVNKDWSAESHTMDDSISWTLELAKLALDEHIKNDYIDPTRIYVMGLSMGGFGTWELLQRYPNFFAGAIPICGGGDPAYAANIATTPVWAVHGAKDKVVLPDRSEEMIIAAQLAGGKAKLTMLKDEAHGVWTYTFTNKEILSWLWLQRRRP